MNTIPSVVIPETRLKRLWCYVCEMFPLHIRIPINLLNFGFIYFGLHAIYGGGLNFSWMAIVGALTVQLLWFFIRVYDELKDAESDIALAKAGDARFINRPIVTGKVKLEDISALRWWMTAFIFGINLAFGSPTLIIGLLIAMGYLTLSFKWFFWPKLKDDIILVFLTHAPNIVVIELYTVAAHMAETQNLSVGWPTVALVMGLWATGLAYEFSYKIRIPADETALNTYSKILGWKTSTCITMLLLAVSSGCTFYAMNAIGLKTYSYFIQGGVTLWSLGGCLFFLVAPTRERANLTKYLGLYWYVSTSAFILACLANN